MCKMGNRKKIQTVRTKQNVSYSEAKKIVESRTPIVGKTYAAATTIISQKSYKSIAIQTDNLITNYNNTNNTSKSLENNGSQSEINTENSSRQDENTPKPSNTLKPVTSKLPLHKKAVPSTSHNKKANVQNSKPYLKKNNSSSSKSREIPYNPAKKSKKEANLPKTGVKNNKNSFSDKDALALHPSDSSENEEGMSTASESEVVDIVI